MIEPEKRKAVFLLHVEGMKEREIARRLSLGRNSVRDIIRQEGRVPVVKSRAKVVIDPELLRRLYTECDGWKQRVHEKLAEEEGIKVPYSTLTRKLRELGIDHQERRCDRVPDQPGAEMQHDTTVYTLKLSGTLTKVIASSIYLRYSKRRYLRFYRSFNRFRMKCFLHEALMYWGYAAPVCIIDNTNLARLKGTGKHAVMVPEMEAFAKQHGFKFVCHELGHCNRKAGEERSFWTVETNFLPGRTFKDLEDLNDQAFKWATERMYHRPVGKAQLIPGKAFDHERAYLCKLSGEIPSPYLSHVRRTDQYGYVAFGGNFYWVPGTHRDEVRVLEYACELKLYRRRELLTKYKLPAWGVTNQLFSPAGLPRPCFEPKNRKHSTTEEENRLRGMGAVVGEYLDFALAPKGNERHRFVRALFHLTQRMTTSLFLKTLGRALKYQIVDVDTVWRIAQLELGEGMEILPEALIDESYQERDAYQEGRLSEAPDFSRWDDMLEEDNG